MYVSVVYAHWHVSVCPFVCGVCRGQRSVLSVSLNVFPPYFLRQDLSVDLEFINSARLSCQWAPGICLSSHPHLPALRLQMPTAMPGICVGAGSANSSPSVCSLGPVLASLLNFQHLFVYFYLFTYLACVHVCVCHRVCQWTARGVGFLLCCVGFGDWTQTGRLSSKHFTCHPWLCFECGNRTGSAGRDWLNTMHQ